MQLPPQLCKRVPRCLVRHQQLHERWAGGEGPQRAQQGLSHRSRWSTGQRTLCCISRQLASLPCQQLELWIGRSSRVPWLGLLRWRRQQRSQHLLINGERCLHATCQVASKVPYQLLKGCSCGYQCTSACRKPTADTAAAAAVRLMLLLRLLLLPQERQQQVLEASLGCHNVLMLQCCRRASSGRPRQRHSAAAAQPGQLARRS